MREYFHKKFRLLDGFIFQLVETVETSSSDAFVDHILSLSTASSVFKSCLAVMQYRYTTGLRCLGEPKANAIGSVYRVCMIDSRNQSRSMAQMHDFFGGHHLPLTRMLL